MSFNLVSQGLNPPAVLFKQTLALQEKRKTVLPVHFNVTSTVEYSGLQQNATVWLQQNATV